jgi:hypothetical protein
MLITVRQRANAEGVNWLVCLEIIGFVLMQANSLCNALKETIPLDKVHQPRLNLATRKGGDMVIKKGGIKPPSIYNP